jgi:hypothetical protein
MSRFTMENEDADALNGNEYVHPNGVDDEDDVYMADAYFDDNGRFDLSQALPNSDDNPVEYVYTRDHTGRVVSVVCHLKVPNKEQVQSTDESRNEDGDVVHCDCQIKEIVLQAGEQDLHKHATTDLHATTDRDNKKKKSTLY